MILKDIPFIDIHTHRRVVANGTQWSAAIHPWRVKHSNLTRLETLLKENRIAAIGETGLDRIHKDTFNLQLEYFEKHILLSEQYQKPLIIHNVKATADILKLHKKHRPSQTWIIHGFNGTTAKVFAYPSAKVYFTQIGKSQNPYHPFLWIISFWRRIPPISPSKRFMEKPQSC